MKIEEMNMKIDKMNLKIKEMNMKIEKKHHEKDKIFNKCKNVFIFLHRNLKFSFANCYTSLSYLILRLLGPNH